MNENKGNCWCCGAECYFCYGYEGGDFCEHPCWCLRCKLGACIDCCGCNDCIKNKRGAYSSDDARIPHLIND